VENYDPRFHPTRSSHHGCNEHPRITDNNRKGRAIPTAAVERNSAAILSLIILLTFVTSGCGGFFVSGDSLRSISLTPNSIFLTVGNAKQLTANGTTVDGDGKVVTNSAKWSSSSGRIASVSAGVVTAFASGNATITASQDGVEDTAGVIVNESVLIDISVTATSTTISSGGTTQFTATATFEDGSEKDITNQVSWTSGNSSKARVSNTGLVTGIGSGTVTITAAVTTSTTREKGSMDISVE